MVNLHSIVRSYYYADLGPDDRKTLHRRAGAFYETEQPDPLLAIEHFLRAGEIEHAAELATADVMAFINRGQAHALPRLLVRFADHPLSDFLRARLILTAGEIHQFDSASEAAQVSYRQVLELARRLPPTPARRSLIVRACQRLGDLLSDQAPAEAKTWLDRGLEEVGADSGLERADLLVTLSTVQIAAGDWAASREAAQTALQETPNLPDQLWMRAQLNLGIVASELGDLDGAIGHTSQAADRARLTHDDFWRVTAEMNLGLDIFTRGDWDGAIQRLTEANELAGRVGSGTQRTQLAVNLGYLLLRRGDDAGAGVQLQAAVNLARQHQLVRQEIAGLLNLAEWQQHQGEFDAALAQVTAAERLASTTHIHGFLPEIYRRRAQIGLAAGDPVAALAAVEQSLAAAVDAPLEQGMSLRVQGRALTASGQFAAAAAALAQPGAPGRREPVRGCAHAVGLGTAAPGAGRRRGQSAALRRGRRVLRAAGRAARSARDMDCKEGRMNTLNLRRRLRLVGALAVSTALTLALLGALFLALRPPAASASGPAPIAAWGTGREPTTSLAVGDMDNDGDLDLVVGNQGEDNRIYLNNGRGGFPTEVRGTITLTNSSPTSVIAVADLNGDGWLDVLALAPGAPAQLYLNAHRGTFTSRLLLTITSPLTPALVIGDLDGDADFDLVVGGANAMTRVYRNDGHAGFSPAPAWLTATEAMSATAMTLADVNGNGDGDGSTSCSDSMGGRCRFFSIEAVQVLCRRTRSVRRVVAWPRWRPAI
ncbi:FG-GAP-like repeat-containing protein [Candidatus Amarolinea dominans]|uniref:FG-GAP-like repeat-containing protein n=1 Tax=Candidatus Amarolinea dominans TaxID=3140696 RepID=UPI001D62DCDD|nr:VCBS repeat-containing protein [Anaerolineae bacterium]